MLTLNLHCLRDKFLQLGEHRGNQHAIQSRTNNDWVVQITNERSNTFTACIQAFQVVIGAFGIQKANARIHNLGGNQRCNFNLNVILFFQGSFDLNKY
jgi:hypothetical protein